MKKPSKKFYVVKKSKIHGTGVYAARDIRKGTKILQYVGELITKKESDKRAKRDQKNGTVYLFEFDDKYDLDGDVDYNDAKYVNHSCEPNCESIDHDGEIWVCAMRTIRKGDELTYDYRFDDVDFEDHPCKCGSKNCRGFIMKDPKED